MKLKKLTKDKIFRALFSLMLAFILWGIASSDSNPTVTSRYSGIKVEYINLTEGLTVDSIEETVDVKLTGTNLQMNKVRKSDLRAIVDLADIDQEGSYTMEVTITGTPDNVSVSEISVKYVLVVVSKITSDKFDIEVETAGSVPSGYVLLDLTTQTDEVKATGSAAKTVDIDRVYGILDIGSMTSDFSIDVPLKAYDGMGNEIEDIQLEPAVVTVEGTIGITKKVTVNPQVHGSCTDGFKVKSYACTPQTVTIGGRQSIINNISEILTESVDVSGRSESFQKTVQLASSNDYILLSDTSVTVNVEIVGYSVSTYTILLPVFQM